LPLPPGQAAWLTALTLFEGGGDLARVEGLVVEALDAAPLLVEELALEPGLSRALEGRPGSGRAEGWARRWGRGRPRPGGPRSCARCDGQARAPGASSRWRRPATCRAPCARPRRGRGSRAS